MIDPLLHDIRFSLRTMRRSPVLTAVALLSLALGIGANTAVFTALNALLVRTAPVEDPERLVFLSWGTRQFPSDSVYLHGKGRATPDGFMTSTAFPYPFFEEAGQRARLLEGLAGFVRLGQVPVTANGTTRPAIAEAVSGGYHATLGVAPAIGRNLDAGDDRPEAPAAAMIGYRFWESRFGRDPGIVGRTITIRNIPCEIVGVESKSFLGLIAGSPPDVIVPLHRLGDFGREWNDPAAPIFTSRDYWWLRIAARLRQGIPESQAQLELGALLRQGLPGLKEPPALSLHHRAEGAEDIREQFSRPLTILMGAVAVVLIIACANVGNLLLARAHAREKETGMRLALGATNSRLIRQHLTESVLLSAVGGVLGFAMASWASDALVSALPTFGDSLIYDLRPDVRVLAFTAAIALSAGILFGLAPALHATRAGHHGPTVTRRSRVAHSLVVVQIAASMIVMAGAGLYVQTLRNLRGIDTGMDTRNLLAFRVKTDPEAGYSQSRSVAVFRQIQERLVGIPGVRSVALASQIPLSGMFHRVPISVPGIKPATFEERVAGVNLVGPHFFETMGIPLRAGRGIVERDTEGSGLVAVVNESLARIYFPNQSPVGRHVYAALGRGEDGPDLRAYEVIGVAADTKFHALRRGFGPGLFAAWSQHADRIDAMSFVLRTSGDSAGMYAAVRRVVSDVDVALPVLSLMPISGQIDAQLKQERLFAGLSSAFGVLALLLAAIGLYGVRSHSVARRTAEIGVRMALGAGRREIVAMIVRETLSLSGTGIGIGLVAGLAIMGLIRSMLFGLAPHDPATFAGAAAVLAIVALSAGFVPALRAARVDPMTALRRD